MFGLTHYKRSQPTTIFKLHLIKLNLQIIFQHLRDLGLNKVPNKIRRGCGGSAAAPSFWYKLNSEDLETNDHKITTIYDDYDDNWNNYVWGFHLKTIAAKKAIAFYI